VTAPIRLVLDCLPRALMEDVVVTARLPDGSLRKITGHERARRWAANPGTGPKQVRALVFSVGSEDDTERLYHEFEKVLSADMM
jgi:hypothetical protein